ncbi:hypothetical protein [Nocardia alni]|uniref:hypothetical protein n=1 Tax=Nocardia alni TaxID=2815723 RepID=UPI001C24C0DC|nr:hypothetical protein [Nocardia alni]
MKNSFRRIATAVAAVAVLTGTGAGIASASPTANEPAKTWWGDSYCTWGSNFNWHYYNFCDRYQWHGSHHNDWQNFHNHNSGYDFDWFRGR